MKNIVIISIIIVNLILNNQCVNKINYGSEEKDFMTYSLSYFLIISPIFSFCLKLLLIPFLL